MYLVKLSNMQSDPGSVLVIIKQGHTGFQQLTFTHCYAMKEVFYYRVHILSLVSIMYKTHNRIYEND